VRVAADTLTVDSREVVDEADESFILKRPERPAARAARDDQVAPRRNLYVRQREDLTLEAHAGVELTDGRAVADDDIFRGLIPSPDASRQVLAEPPSELMKNRLTEISPAACAVTY
jgi:hypothetical protein